MTPEQQNLIRQARDSADAAETLRGAGHHGFAASRAYYAMFYIAEAFLLGKGLTFSKHSAVIAAFGEHFARPAIVPPEYHRWLIAGVAARHAGDYGAPGSITSGESAEQIARARQFISLADGRLDAVR